MAELRTIAAQLRRMNDVQISNIERRELRRAAAPFAPMIRSAILNIATHGDKHTGLRVRIAECVQTWSSVRGNDVSVGVEIDSSRMPSGQYSLPLMMNGNKVWRHPVFGDSPWVTQGPHPYFYQTVAGMGPASRVAMGRALQKITDAING